jgi:hypothetical protein
MDYSPTSGRIVVRRAGQAFVALGVLHFGPHDFRPEEGTGYPLVISAGRLHATPMAGKPLAYHELTGGISSWARIHSWRQFRKPEMGGRVVEARFVHAFRNGWSFVAISKQDPFEAQLTETHRQAVHYWADIDADAKVTGIPPPTDEKLEGMALGGILRDLPVWPDGKGGLRTLPALPRACREPANLANLLLAMRAAGELTDSAYAEIMRACPTVDAFRSLSRDRGYERFLLEMRKRGELKPERAVTAEELEAREALATDLTGQWVADERRSELARLAEAVGVATPTAPRSRE